MIREQRADPTVISFLYDLDGEWIAFRTDYDGKYLFDVNGEWIGWFPWHDDDAVDRNGHYLATVLENRLLRRLEPGYHAVPDYPGEPEYPGSVGYPGRMGYFGSMPGYADIDHSKVAV